MLETESFPSRVLSPFREESGDEELSILPRHTKVIVTGNNRTKSVLVGLKRVVKKAVGLGGWHWLVLKNGVEVKLQRNALSVLEPPTGNEEDIDFDFDDSTSCSDIGEKDHHQFYPSSAHYVTYENMHYRRCHLTFSQRFIRQGSPLCEGRKTFCFLVEEHKIVKKLLKIQKAREKLAAKS